MKESTPVDHMAWQYGVVPLDLQRAPMSVAHHGASAATPAHDAAHAAHATPKTGDAAELAEQAWQIIMDKLAIERERRGFASWP